MTEYFKVELTVLIPVDEVGDEHTAVQMAHGEGKIDSSYVSTIEVNDG